MAAIDHTQYTSITFGAPSLSGYVVTDITVTSTAALYVPLYNELGVRKAAHYDDVTKEVSFDAYLNGATPPTPGAVFTIDSIKYETTSIEVKKSNKDYIHVAIKGITSEGITLS